MRAHLQKPARLQPPAPSRTMASPAQTRLVAQARMLNARSGTVTQRMRASGHGSGVVQRAILVGADSRTPAEWRALLDPDGANAALAAALDALDGREFASEEDLRAAITAQNPVHEGEQGGEEGVIEAPFGSIEAGLEYLAANTGVDLEQIQAFENFKPEWFSYLAEMTPSEIDLAEWTKDLTNLEFMYDKYLATAPTGAGGSGGDWATKKIRGAAKRLVEKADEPELFKGGKYTVHHKVSRSKLRKLHGKMESVPADRTAALYGILETIGAQAGSTSAKKTLLNIPANLEVGPQNREGDPGSGFDPNYEGGAITPRSELLGHFDSAMDVEPINFDHLAELLRQVHLLHRDALHGEEGPLTGPRTDQWKKNGGKFKRE